MYPEGRLWGLKLPVESSIFVCVCAQKMLSKLCSCIYEIQKFCAGKRKNLYSYFYILLQFLGFAPGPHLGISAL